MIRKSGHRFSEKIMLKQKDRARWQFSEEPSRSSEAITRHKSRSLRRFAPRNDGSWPALKCSYCHGSTRTLAWCSGFANAAKASFTPFSPTWPVISGVASIMPSAM